MWGRKLLVAGVALSAMVLSSGEAHAADYLCRAGLRAGSSTSTLGTDGYINFLVYNGPDCTGTFVGAYYLCSPGATSTSCASSSSYHYSEAQLVGLIQTMQHAIESNTRINHLAQQCNGGALACGSTIDFRGD
jgi:hypothetical protein